MEKVLKKFMAIIAILSMIVAFIPTKLFAADDDITITVKGAVAGRTLSVYKLFNIDKETTDETTGKTTYHYSWAGKAESFFAQYTPKKETITEAIDYMKGLSSSELNTLAEAYKTYAKNQGVTADDTKTGETGAESLNLTVNGKGYYLVFDETDLQAAGKEARAVAMLNNVTKNTEIEIKVDEISKPGKTADHESANVDGKDVITYTLTADVPTMAGYDKYTFQFVDTLSKGLTYGEIVSVKINDTDISNTASDTATSYTATPTTNTDGTTTLTIDFANFILQKANAGKKVEVKYTAKLNENAIQTGDAPNTVKLVYSNDPYSDGKGDTDETEEHVYTYTVEFTKKNTAGAVLKDAEFELRNSEGKVIGTAKSDENGKFSFKGLATGSYKLVETKAPEGYAVPNFDGFEFTITHHLKEDGTLDNVTFDYTSDLNNDVAKGFMVDTTSTTTTITVDLLNAKDGVLPSTGGMGTKIFTAVGIGIMVVVAGVFVFINRKK